MNLQRDLADAQLGRGLLVKKSVYHQRQDLALAWGQARKALMQSVCLESLPRVCNTLEIVERFGIMVQNALFAFLANLL